MKVRGVRHEKQQRAVLFGMAVDAVSVTEKEMFLTALVTSLVVGIIVSCFRFESLMSHVEFYLQCESL